MNQDRDGHGDDQVLGLGKEEKEKEKPQGNGILPPS